MMTLSTRKEIIHINHKLQDIIDAQDYIRNCDESVRLSILNSYSKWRNYQLK